MKAFMARLALITAPAARTSFYLESMLAGFLPTALILTGRRAIRINVVSLFWRLTWPGFCSLS